MARVEWHPIAERQLHDAIQFIDDDRPGSGTRFAKQVLQAVDRVRRYPQSGRVIPESGGEFRELIVGRFRIMYGIYDRVVVLAVVHGARDFDSKDLPHD